jgi:hypothetical protein
VTRDGARERLLVALAAALAPAHAARLLARAAGEDGRRLAREATRAARDPRLQRLEALAAAVAGCAPRGPERASRLDALASSERPGVAAALRRRVAGPAGGGRDLLRRLVEERLHAPAVRAEDGRPPGGP